MKTVQKILVPVDFSEQSAKGLKYAASLAQEMKAELIVLHVFDKNKRYPMLESLATLEGWPVPPRGFPRIPVDVWFREKALDLYHFIEKGIRDPGRLKIKRRVRIGKPVEEIITLAREEEVDLIVLQTRKESFFSYLTARGRFLKLIWQFPYPVLLTPPRSDDGREPGRPLIFLPILGEL